MIELLSTFLGSAIRSACIIFALDGSLDKKNRYSDIYTVVGLFILFLGNIIAISFDMKHAIYKDIFILIFMILYVLISRSGSLSKKIFVIASYASMVTALGLISLIIVPIIIGDRFLSCSYLILGSTYFYLILKLIQIIFTVFFVKKVKMYKFVDDTILNWMTLGFVCINLMSINLIRDIVISNIVVDATVIAFGLGFVITTFTLFIMLSHIYKVVEKNIQLRYISEYEKSESKHSDEMIKMYEEMKGWRHDFRNHLNIIINLIENKEYEEAISYLSEIDEKSGSIEDVIYTDKVSINAILNIKKSIANDLGIVMLLEIDDLGEIDISKVDLITVISNKLDNAIEACEDVLGNKFIEVVIFKNPNQLIIKVKNSTSKNIKLKNGTYISSKAKKYEDLERGLGLIQIDKIVNKYGGYINRNYNESYFESVAMLPLNQNNREK